MSHQTPPPAPPMALRTYGFLRLGMVAVIAALAVSVVTEIVRADGCVQRSISAYYYTPVRSVFVGALATLGLCMIALWGKNAVEDSFLNLAGMLAPVVAFVPTADANFCSIVTSTGGYLVEPEKTGGIGSRAAQTQTNELIKTAHDAVYNNVVTLIAVIGLTLLLLGWYAARRPSDQMAFGDKSFALPYGTAVLVWAAGGYLFSQERPWFYEKAHMWSAILLFGFIIVVVLASAFDSDGHPPWRRPFDRRPPGWKWRLTYFVLGVVMVLSAVVIPVTGAWLAGEGTWLADHWVFTVESTLIGLFGVFWVLQSIQRAQLGAPRPVARADATADERAPA